MNNNYTKMSEPICFGTYSVISASARAENDCGACSRFLICSLDPSKKRRHKSRSRFPAWFCRRPDDPAQVETLVRMKRWPSLQKKWRASNVRIFSREHDAYWRPGGAGYTVDGLQAGVFSFNEALRITHGAGPEKRIEFRKA